MYSPEKLHLRGNVPKADEERARRDLAGYYAHCTALDDCFAELLRTLDENGLSENTIVVFTSDHGDMLWSQDQQRKQRPWEESVRVPLLIRVPASLGIKAQRTEATINSEDVMPTLLSLCGRPVPKSVEGFDFSGAMRGEADPSGGASVIRCIAPFGEYSRQHGGREYRGIRTARYTYVRGLEGPWLLYDNRADPEQLQNRIDRPEYAAIQREMEGLLKKKLAEQHDEFLPGEEYIKRWGYQVDATGTMPYKP